MMKLRNVVLLFGLLSLMVCGPTLGQEPQRVRMQAPQKGSHKMLNEDGKAVVPFEFISSHVVIPVEINGKTLNLILDTGMPIDGALLFGSEAVDALGLQFVGKAPVMGVGGGRVESDLAMGVSFKLPGVELTNQMVLVTPRDSTRSRHFEGKDGVIGNSLFSHFAVRIDHDSMKVTLSDQERFEYAGSGAEMPLRIDRYPFLSCEVEIAEGVTVPVELVVDTGNGAALTLNVGAEEGIVLPEKVLEYHTRSMGPEILRLTGRIERLRLGPYVLENVLGSFRTPDHEPPPPWAKAGGVGQGVLRRFNTVFDYAHKRIILEPNRYFGEPFEFNMAGLQFIRATQGRLEVTRVIPSSPASEVGLLAGDQIVRINGRPASQFSQDELDRLLKQEGEEIEFDINRGEESLQLQLKLRRLM